MIQASTADVISRGDPGASVLDFRTHLMVKHYNGTTNNMLNRREVWNRVITDAGRNYLVDAFKNSTSAPSNFNYHDFGTSTAAESTSDTALGTAVAEARVTGTQATTGGTYTSVGTMTFSTGYAITEHGLFSSTAKPGGTLLDRTMFAAVNASSGDSVQATFTLTINAGG